METFRLLFKCLIWYFDGVRICDIITDVSPDALLNVPNIALVSNAGIEMGADFQKRREEVKFTDMNSAGAKSNGI